MADIGLDDKVYEVHGDLSIHTTTLAEHLKEHWLTRVTTEPRSKQGVSPDLLQKANEERKELSKYGFRNAGPLIFSSRAKARNYVKKRSATAITLPKNSRRTSYKEKADKSGVDVKEIAEPQDTLEKKE